MKLVDLSGQITAKSSARRAVEPRDVLFGTARSLVGGGVSLVPNKRFNDQLISGESFFCRLSDRDNSARVCLYDSGGSIPDSTNPFLFGTVCAAKQHPMLRFHAVSENSASAVIAGWGEFMNRAFETIKDVGRSGKCDLKSLVVFITTNFTGRHVRTPLLAIVNEGVCSSSERRLITIRREPQ